MNDNLLTESQKALLKWMVQAVRAGKLNEEEIWMVDTFNGIRLDCYEDNVPEIKKLTLDALQKNGYLICDRSHPYQYKCALTSRAYDLVTSNSKTMSRIKILFLSADPSDACRLRLGQELRDIREKLQLSQKRDSFILESRESVRPGDITQAIHDVAPQIVHFSGHGKNTGELCVEDNSGKTKSISPDAIASLFKLVSDRVSCVILNACYSDAQAQGISRSIPFVIGMAQSIGDKAAISFAVGFYKALGAGHSFEQAYDFAKVEIQLEGIPEHSIPILYKKRKREDNSDKVILSNSEVVTVEEAIHRFDVSPIIKRFGTWAVTTYGLECLAIQYEIELERVDEEDWIDHMRRKTWVNMADFEKALSFAREFKSKK